MTTDSTEAAFRKVKVGMTKAEVDQFFPDKRALTQDGSTWMYMTPSRFRRPFRDVLVEFRQEDESVQFFYLPRTTPESQFFDLKRITESQLFDLPKRTPETIVKDVIGDRNDPRDSRTLWQRIQDEYRYQRRRLGW
jgi:hypothetical protein